MFVRLACSTPPAPKAPPASKTATALVASITTRPPPACNVFRVNSTLTLTSTNARTVLQENTLYTMKLLVPTPAKSARRASTLALGKHCVQTVLNTPTHPTAARQFITVLVMLDMGSTTRHYTVNGVSKGHSNLNPAMSSVRPAPVQTTNLKPLHVTASLYSNAMIALYVVTKLTLEHHVRLTKTHHASGLPVTPNAKLVKCVELAPRN